MDKRNTPEDLKRKPQGRPVGFDNDIHSNSNSVDLMSNSRKRKRSKKQKMYIVLNVILSVILVVSSFTCIGASLLNAQVIHDNRIDEQEQGDFEDIVVSPNENVAYFLVCGVDLSESLTDVIMVVCYDLANNKASILQIERDMFVGTEIPSGKINAVYGSPREGESHIKALIRCINQKFALPIDHYITITIHGTEKVIDALGGVDIKLTKDDFSCGVSDGYLNLIDDSRKPKQYKDIELGGTVHLDGQWGTAFLRHRSSYLQGDMGRVTGQRKMYAALLKKIMKLDFGTITKIVTTAANEVSTDLTLGEMLGYAEKVKDITMKDVEIMSVPGQAGMYSPTGQSLSYFTIHRGEYAQMLNDYFRPYDTEVITADDIECPSLYERYDNDYGDFLEGGSLDDFDNDREPTTAPDTDEDE